MFSYIIILIAVVFMSAVQIIIKYRFTAVHGEIPLSTGDFPVFLWNALKDPFLWLAGITLIVAAILWYAAISRMSLGVAFAFAALSYPLVMTGSYVFLGELFRIPQMVGCGFIVAGILLIANFA